ncbi:MAG: IS110 family transposase, partial [Planctomycetota bacterium]
MKPWSDITHLIGFDWASEHHDVVVVDKAGAVVARFRFENTAAGWTEFFQEVKSFPVVAIAIETCHGAAVERLLAAGLIVYPVNPKSAQRYRERKAPSGVKSDELDAWSLADALRVDGHNWKALRPEDPLLQELRQLCRDEVALIEQRTAFVNQLQAALREYYPTALEAFDQWTRESAWAFVEAFPTPQELVSAGKRKWQKFLHVHKLFRPEINEERMALFARALEFCGTAPTIAAKSLLASTLAKMLRTLQRQLDNYRERIEKLFAQHPDHDLFGSLPGAGGKIAPRLLSEIGDDRARFGDAEGLQAYAGTAPVSFITGKARKVKLRRACNKNLRSAVHFLANLSRAKCAWAQVYYENKREKGMTHACALRCLGQRWLKILWKMWATHTNYDPELHQKNQLKHGSWVLSMSQPAPQTT